MRPSAPNPLQTRISVLASLQTRGMIPGYIITPDFPECIDDFGMLWFEVEYAVSAANEWILAANAAGALTKLNAPSAKPMHLASLLGARRNGYTS